MRPIIITSILLGSLGCCYVAIRWPLETIAVILVVTAGIEARWRWQAWRDWPRGRVVR